MIQEFAGNFVEHFIENGNRKRQHLRGFQAKNGWERAPMLVFA